MCVCIYVCKCVYVQCAFVGGQNTCVVWICMGSMCSVHLYMWECVCSVHLGGGHVYTHTEAGRCKVPSPVTQHLISMR